VIGGRISASGIVSRVSSSQTGLRNCTRDEGRSFEVGNQALISSHRELFAWLGDDRYSSRSRSVYLQIYARPSAYPIDDNYYSGGRTFNGPPNTGGGVIQMELAYLMGKDNYPFLSTLIHELGHAFGLTHADATTTTWKPTVR
jgi:hypothetical protein